MAIDDAVRRIPRERLVYTYSSEHAPVARVHDGETVLVETKNAFGDHGLSPGDTLDALDLSQCDPLTGPIFVEGAEPGDTLAVHIERLDVVGVGLHGIIPNFGALPDWPGRPLHFLTPEDGKVPWLRGIELEVQPNLGIIGVAPAEGPIPSLHPGDHGGNQDTKFVCAGSTILLPVFHPGALLFLGDCHQIQTDGELCGVAPETDAEATIRVEVIKGTIPRPRIVTADRVMNLASAPTLEGAVRLAVEDTIEQLVAEKGFSRDEAYLLLSVKADIEICQVVDPLMTVRVAMDRSFFESLPTSQRSTEP